MEQNKWYTDESGLQHFDYEDWKIVASHFTPYITCPDNNLKIDITAEGLNISDKNNMSILIPWTIIVNAFAASKTLRSLSKVKNV